MGKVKRIAVTGAGGFLGQRILHHAAEAGLEVVAVLRRPQILTQPCEIVVTDLAKSETPALAEEIGPVDAIIHAAGEMSSDISLHARSTLPATRSIARLAERTGAHLVQISSISVYDYLALPENSTITEDTPLEPHPETRDGYVAAKLDQEALVLHHCPDASLLRAGALYGAGRVWNAHVGIGIGPLLLQLSRGGQIPLCHVDRCAQVAVQAALGRAQGALNLLDADLPDRNRFLTALRPSGWPRFTLPLSWRGFELIGRALAWWRRRPGLLRAPVLHARMKPMHFDSAKLQARHPAPMPDFETQMREALNG